MAYIAYIPRQPTLGFLRVVAIECVRSMNDNEYLSSEACHLFGPEQQLLTALLEALFVSSSSLVSL